MLENEECPEKCDPLTEENPIIFSVGPLTGLYPLASKTVSVFKFPHTGNLGESHCGGRSAVAIRMAGYGAIVIKGKSEIPVYLSINKNGVNFRNASSLWGMNSTFTVGRIIRENEAGAGLKTIMRIGRAGEKLVSYAGVITETYRHFGRLGLGALPTRNLASGSFEKVEAISGEKLAQNYLGRRLACSHCPVACIHIAALREPYADEPFFTKHPYTAENI